MQEKCICGWKYLGLQRESSYNYTGKTLLSIAVKWNVRFCYILSGRIGNNLYEAYVPKLYSLKKF